MNLINCKVYCNLIRDKFYYWLITTSLALANRLVPSSRLSSSALQDWRL